MKKESVNPFVKIMIVTFPGDTDEGIYVSANAKSAMIKPGVEVSVDPDIYAALMNSRYAPMVIRR